MRKTFKRIVTLLLVAAMALVVLTACGKKCVECGEKATETVTIDGEKKHVCDDCYVLYKFAEGVSDLADAFS